MSGFNTPAILALCALIGVGTVFWKAAMWKGAVDADRKMADAYRTTVADFMKEIRDDFREVRDDIKKLFREFPKDTVKRTSPTRLSELGERISAQLKAQEWAQERARTLGAEVQGMEPYQVDLFAFNYVYDKLPVGDTDMSTRASKCAYEFGLSRDNVLAVLQVVLRDDLLRRRGLSTET